MIKNGKVHLSWVICKFQTVIVSLNKCQLCHSLYHDYRSIYDTESREKMKLLYKMHKEHIMLITNMKGTPDQLYIHAFEVCINALRKRNYGNNTVK